MITRPCDDRNAALALLRRHRITTGKERYFSCPAVPIQILREGVLVKHHPDEDVLIISHTKREDVSTAVSLLRSRGFKARAL